MLKDLVSGGGNESSSKARTLPACGDESLATRDRSNHTTRTALLSERGPCAGLHSQVANTLLIHAAA